MKKIRIRRVQWLVCSSGIIAALSLVSCALGPGGTSGVTPVSVAMLATDATAADALATIKAALNQTPVVVATADREKQTQTAVAVAAATATQAMLDATQTGAALPPTATLPPTPNLDATAAQQATEQALAVAATLTALAPSPTETPTATPNLAATDQEQATQRAAINGTLTALAPTPDLDATRAEENHQMEIAVAATLTEVAAHFTPTPMPTDTPQPPTAIPVPPTSTRAPTRPRPTNTPRPPARPSGLFRGSVNPICTGERNMTWFEGTVYVNGQPANGYKVAFKSYLVPGDQPATNPAISGPHDGYTDWANGYYAHIVNDHFEKKHLEVWIINDAGQAISDRVRWNSDGTEGPCNKAIINFAQ